MLFNFQLRDLKLVQPFLDAEELPYLDWFALTDGWYWMESPDGSELLRYTSAALKQWEAEFGPSDLPYVDYYVVRLWEDMLDILPDVLNPVPEPTAVRLEEPSEWLDWLARVEVWMLDQDEADEEPLNLYLQAAGWWSERMLDLSYLDDEPLLVFWRVDDHIHIYWDSLNGEKLVWACDKLHVTMPVEDFRREMKHFHKRMIQEMSERISMVLGQWDDVGIRVEGDELKQEQRARSTWLDEQLHTLPDENWDAVLKTIAQLDQHV